MLMGLSAKAAELQNISPVAAHQHQRTDIS